MGVKPSTNGWSLEVVRGKDVGRSFALNGGALVLGNSLGGEVGIDLSEQEGTAPRRMAAKQAQLECTAAGLILRDLDSPGGTFVNRQRILPSQARTLQAGDVIQLGSVQLKVVSGAAKPAQATEPKPAESAPPAVPLPEPFTLATGAACRSWDDFLTVSAQRWPAMREELTSGRLAAFLVKARRPDLVPSPQSPGTPDERLDAWLAALPTTRPSRPELDVHPSTLTVRVVPGGGQTRQTVRITNTGYRLLRSTIRVEPAGTTWLKVADAFNRGPIVTIDQTDVAVEVEIPDTLDRAMSAALVIDGNGGSRRVDVRLERAAVAAEMLDPGPSAYVPGFDLPSAIARRSIPVRVAVGVLAGLLLRSLLMAGAYVSAGAPLRGAIVVMAAAGACCAAAVAGRRGEKRDLFPAAFAGAVGGALVAAVMSAASQALELRAIASNAAVACLLWAGVGAGLAAISAWLIPFQKGSEARP